MIGRLRQLSEPRLRQQAGIEKSQTPVERDILIQWVRKLHPCFLKIVKVGNNFCVFLIAYLDDELKKTFQNDVYSSRFYCNM